MRASAALPLSVTLLELPRMLLSEVPPQPAPHQLAPNSADVQYQQPEAPKQAFRRPCLASPL